MDGIQLKAKARVTVRTNINTLIGGATRKPLSPVLVKASSPPLVPESHKKVLENPDSISKVVLARGLDAGTAFEILSIDIADVDVGENIGLPTADHAGRGHENIAQARAEERRAMAQAREQEMRAQVVEMRARVVQAEAEVPKAIAEAFRSGNLGIMDYYRMKNIMADTDMRQSISGVETKKEDKNT